LQRTLQIKLMQIAKQIERALPPILFIVTKSIAHLSQGMW